MKEGKPSTLVRAHAVHEDDVGGGALTRRKQSDSNCSYQVLVNHVRWREGQIGSSRLALGQLWPRLRFQGLRHWLLGAVMGCLSLHTAFVCRRRASGIWVLGASPELGGEFDGCAGAPRASAASCACSCDPSLGSEFLLPSTRPFLSGHWARESIELALFLITLN